MAVESNIVSYAKVASDARTAADSADRIAAIRLSLVVLPLVLAGVMVVAERAGRAGEAGERNPGGPLLLLATIAIATHPFLDWLNTYGIFRDIYKMF